MICTLEETGTIDLYISPPLSYARSKIKELFLQKVNVMIHLFFFQGINPILPFKGTFPPTYRSFDPVLTSQLPFKGIEARSLFVYMSAMTPASHHVVAGLGWVNPARCQGSHCLSTGWVSQHRPGGGAMKMPKRPLGSIRDGVMADM